MVMMTATEKSMLVGSDGGRQRIAGQLEVFDPLKYHKLLR